jgi:beta-N-acetylhexosaminidase
VCNNRESACIALAGIENLPLPNQARLERMRGKIPQISIDETFDLGNEWQAVKKVIEEFKNSL